TYFDYFSPLPWKLRNFFHAYDTEWHETTIEMFGITWKDALTGLIFLIACGIVFSLISYKRIRKRTV
ncbi:MAG: hypothetical protein IJB88_01680, partial [Clostridia bacterium]|nr:hypothetical protein [Clostridia bacterium]